MVPRAQVSAQAWHIIQQQQRFSPRGHSPVVANSKEPVKDGGRAVTHISTQGSASELMVLSPSTNAAQSDFPDVQNEAADGRCRCAPRHLHPYRCAHDDGALHENQRATFSAQARPCKTRAGTTAGRLGATSSCTSSRSLTEPLEPARCGARRGEICCRCVSTSIGGS